VKKKKNDDNKNPLRISWTETNLLKKEGKEYKQASFTLKILRLEEVKGEDTQPDKLKDIEVSARNL
jgi:hypothetical protein